MFEYEIIGSPYTLRFLEEPREDPKGDDFFEKRKIIRVEIMEYTGKKSTDRIGHIRLNNVGDGLSFELDGHKVKQIC